MADGELVDLLKQGVEAWNAARVAARPKAWWEARTTGADLIPAGLTLAPFSRVDLTGANLSQKVLREANLSSERRRAFGRCVDCNTPFERISSETARPRVPAYVARTRSRFRYCPQCDRVFWRATHVAEMEDRLHRLNLLETESAETAT